MRVTQPTRRIALVAAALLFLVSGQLLAAERPNVLWIISDDLSPELGCYGYEGVKTPNLDRLAAGGALYTNAFATAPVCSSSRSALITGVYQTSTGTHHHRTLNKPELAAPIEPITELMRRAGYFVCNSNSAMKRAGKTDYNFTFKGKLFDTADWTVKAGGRKEGQPFFAQVQIHEPHRKFAKAENPKRFAKARIPKYYPEHPVVQADWADYLHTVEVLDSKVGKVLARLENEGLADNTVVFFFGDHGRPHYRDKQWLYDGGIRVPLIVRWPDKIPRGQQREQLVSLIDVSAATLKIAGIATPAWMHGRDLLADGFAGRELIFAARDRCGSTLDRIRCVRTERYKYIRNFHPELPYAQHSGYKVLQYPALTAAQVLYSRGDLTGPPAAFFAAERPAEEVYDLQADPEELNNLAADPAHKSKLQQLATALDRWIEQTDDQGRYLEADQKEAVEASERWYTSQMKRRGFTRQLDLNSYLRWWEHQLGVK